MLVTNVTIDLDSNNQERMACKGGCYQQKLEKEMGGGSFQLFSGLLRRRSSKKKYLM